MSRPLMAGTMRERMPSGSTEAGRGSMPDCSHEKARPGNYAPGRPAPSPARLASGVGHVADGVAHGASALGGEALAIAQGHRIDVVGHAGLARVCQTLRLGNCKAGLGTVVGPGGARHAG